jgi:hypothetical protein
MSQLILQLVIIGLLYIGTNRPTQPVVTCTLYARRCSRTLRSINVFTGTKYLRGVKPCLVSQRECTSVSRYGRSEVREICA